MANVTSFATARATVRLIAALTVSMLLLPGRGLAQGPAYYHMRLYVVDAHAMQAAQGGVDAVMKVIAQHGVAPRTTVLVLPRVFGSEVPPIELSSSAPLDQSLERVRQVLSGAPSFGSPIGIVQARRTIKQVVTGWMGSNVDTHRMHIVWIGNTWRFSSLDAGDNRYSDQCVEEQINLNTVFPRMALQIHPFEGGTLPPAHAHRALVKALSPDLSRAKFLGVFPPNCATSVVPTDLPQDERLQECPMWVSVQRAAVRACPADPNTSTTGPGPTAGGNNATGNQPSGPATSPTASGTTTAELPFPLTLALSFSPTPSSGVGGNILLQVQGSPNQVDATLVLTSGTSTETLAPGAALDPATALGAVAGAMIDVAVQLTPGGACNGPPSGPVQVALEVSGASVTSTGRYAATVRGFDCRLPRLVRIPLTQLQVK